MKLHMSITSRNYDFIWILQASDSTAKLHI